MFTTKIIAAIVGALGLGFTGTYFAANNGDSCNGECPISRMINSISGSSEAIMQPCCSAVKSEAKTPDCCFEGSPCCEGGDCCLIKTKVAVKKVTPDCCFEGSPCCEGGDCCLTKTKAAK